MKKNELIEFLQRQIEYLQGQLDEALSSVNSLTLSNEKLQSTNDRLVATVDELRKQIASLEDAVKGKGAELSKEKAARQAVQRLQGSPSERQAKPVSTPATSGTRQQKLEKKRTNNGAKRKTHPECEVKTIIVEPDSPASIPRRRRLSASAMSCATSWSRCASRKLSTRSENTCRTRKYTKAPLPPHRCSTRSIHLPS